MAGIVKSIEKVSITLVATDLTESASLTSQTIANCVPFASWRLTTEATPEDSWDQNNHDIVIESGPQVTASTTNADERESVVECSVVEFDPTYVNVQSGTFSISASTASSGSVTIGTAVTTSKSWMIHYYKVGSDASPTNVEAAVRGRITGTNTVEFDRAAASGPAISGHWWVVECKNTEWDVQTVDMLQVSTGEETGTIGTTVTPARTFCIASNHSTSGSSDDSNDSAYMYLKDGDTVAMNRTAGGGDNQGHFQIVQFASGGDELVQRGVREEATITGNAVSFDITTAVDEAKSIVRPVCHSWRSGFTKGSSSNDTAGSIAAWSWVDTGASANTIQYQHHLAAGDQIDLRFPWEVIEWEFATAGPGPARRVMVIS
jgi:hypothetical protein